MANTSYNVAASGDHVSLKCSSVGFPEPVCRIYFKGNMLGINGSFHVIQNFAEGDQGNYV